LDISVTRRRFARGVVSGSRRIRWNKVNMKTRWLSLVGFGAVLLGAVMAAEVPPATRPNVLLVYADDLDTRLGCYGDAAARTPNIDRLAGRGVRFDRAYCQMPTCGPSRTALMTGLYTWQSGVVANEAFRAKLPDIVTLPQWLRSQGYFTARVGKVYHMGIPGDIGRPGSDDPKSWDLAINNSGWDALAETKAAIHRPSRKHGLGVAVAKTAKQTP
jgi:uncharacterized sulfatase